MFDGNNNFSEIDGTLSTENSNFPWNNDLVTFVDSHDLSRLLTVNNNTNRLHEAMAFLLTSRGIPVIFTGTSSTSTTTPTAAATLTTASDDFVQHDHDRLSAHQQARRSPPDQRRLAYGDSTQRWINNDVYIFERKFFNDVVLVAVNKNDTTSYASPV